MGYFLDYACTVSPVAMETDDFIMFYSRFGHSTSVNPSRLVLLWSSNKGEIRGFITYLSNTNAILDIQTDIVTAILLLGNPSCSTHLYELNELMNKFSTFFRFPMNSRSKRVPNARMRDPDKLKTKYMSGTYRRGD
ncbi:hypothetical protein CBL_07328 [Carabus blaptoides fortunei]